MTIDPRIAGLALALVAMPALGQSTQPKLANPASQNCIAKGGQLTIERNGSGGQFGVCTFPDNLQCEEWALMRGDCRAGGVKVTGYVTAAARYCAITGGAYAVVAASNTPDEKGKCTFAGGKTCDAAAYFDGKCSRQPARTAAATTIRAHFACSGGKAVDAVFTNGATSAVALKLSDGRSMTLPQAMSGSGARYANGNESFVFWNKGDTAFIEENGKTTYDGCMTKPGK